MDKKVKIYNQKGEPVKELDLNPSIFGVKVNPRVIQQVVLAMQAAQRTNLAHTKDRGEVRGGGRKPWKQKGTGRARHGSNRSPLWVGGGVTFGPRNDRNYELKVNKQMRRKALLMALSDRVNDDKVLGVEGFDTTEYKTKKIFEVLKNLKLSKSVLVVNDKAEIKLAKSVSNIPKVEFIEAKNLNALIVTKYKNILMSEASFEVLNKTFAVKKTK
jgi:large subunit ribosomal protein L4